MKHGGRLAFIDALKGLASQLIVLHHLAFYGPMSDYAQTVCPALIAWLNDYARIAVQAFLVMGGFLAAQALARDPDLAQKNLARLLWRRYLKLVPPYLAALVLALLAAALARSLMSHEATPGIPTLPQLLAHVVLLHGILSFDGLSAGAWYIAIDFQLYALLLLALWLTRRALPNSPTAAPLVIAALLLASLFHFNRDASWDNWAIYFFGSYGLGALIYLSVRQNAASRWLTVLLALSVVALAIDFRSRIAVALLVALALGFSLYTGTIAHWPRSRIMGWFGKISYSVFLVHYPICLVINALFERYVAHTPEIQFVGMVLAWAASIAGGALFYQQVESRAQKLLPAKSPTAGPAA